MTAAEHVRVVLAEFKRQGGPFDLAWARALQTLPRGGRNHNARQQADLDLRCVQWAKPAWRAAYDGGGYKVDVISENLTVLAYDPNLPWIDLHSLAAITSVAGQEDEPAGPPPDARPVAA